MFLPPCEGVDDLTALGCMCVSMFILLFLFIFVFAAMRGCRRSDGTGLYVCKYVYFVIFIYFCFCLQARVWTI
jgi:hypothetical protein